MRSNLEGLEIRRSVLWDVRESIAVQTLTGTYTMLDGMPRVHFLNPGGSARTVLLPVAYKGGYYLIRNTGTSAATITIKDSTNSTTFATAQIGQSVEVYSDGTTWYTSAIATSGTPVFTGDVTAYTILAADSGRTIITPDVTSNITLTLPTPSSGLSYTWWYGGVAADAQNHIFTGGAGNFLKGGIVNLDEDAGPASDEVISTFGNGTSHITLTVTTPKCGCELKFVSDGAVWYVNGRVVSVSAAAFS